MGIINTIIIDEQYSPSSNSSSDYKGGNIKVGLLKDFILSNCSFATLVSDNSPNEEGKTKRIVSIQFLNFVVILSAVDTRSYRYGSVNMQLKNLNNQELSGYPSGGFVSGPFYTFAGADVFALFAEQKSLPVYVFYNQGEKVIQRTSLYNNSLAFLDISTYAVFGHLTSDYKAPILKAMVGSSEFGTQIYGISNSQLGLLGVTLPSQIYDCSLLKDENNDVWLLHNNILYR